jgi:galactosyl transferase GMA12/MNN10 family
MNPHTPLDIFLPPNSHPELSTVNLLMAANWDGLNSGAFGIRVHPWSVSFMSAVLAYPIYESERMKHDAFRDQSAFQWLLQAPDSPLAATPLQGREHWAEVPMRWFNSLPINNAFGRNGEWIYGLNMTGDLFDNGTTHVREDGQGEYVQSWKIMQGDMIVHFAGSTAGGTRDSWMEGWLERAEAVLPAWSNATTQERLRVKAKEFWKVTAAKMNLDRQRLTAEIMLSPSRINRPGHNPAKEAKETKEAKESKDPKGTAKGRTIAGKSFRNVSVATTQNNRNRPW